MINRDMKEHLDHIKQVLATLRENELFVNFTKCVFLIRRVVFLLYVVNSEGIHVDECKVKTVRDWPTPKFIIDMRAFMA